MQDGKQKRGNIAKNIDFSILAPCSQISGDDTKDTELLNVHKKYAEDWLVSFRWCKSIRECFFGCGLGSVIAVFLMRIEAESQDIDEYLWVVVGDVPPAYLVTDDAPTPADALRIYCAEMQAWVDAVRMGMSISGCIPVSAMPSPENADALEKRLTTLQKLDIVERPLILRGRTTGVQ